MLNPVAVVIPLYTTELPEFEWQALQHNIRALRHCRIFFACPKRLDLEGLPVYIDRKAVQTICFDNQYFDSIEGYNKLLRSNLFYDRFSDFEFMLLLQTDAIVFSGDLSPFTAKPYDYWGAPWVGFELINYKFLRPVLPFFHKYRRLRFLRKWFGPRYLVGNGGFSLRRVSSFARFTREHREFIDRFEAGYDTWIKGGAKSMMEDVFWCLYVPASFPDFRIAPWREAKHFAFEMSPREVYTMNGNKLPFGCHAFAKVDPEFVQQFIPFPIR
jgi:Protein of unknown function (DUF5672)